MQKPDRTTGFELARMAKKSKKMQEEINEAMMKYSIKKSMDDASEKG